THSRYPCKRTAWREPSICALESWARHEAHQHVLEAAVDDDLLTIDEAGAVTGEEQHDLRHILWRTDTPEWDGSSPPLHHAGRLVKAFAHRRPHEARAEDVA